MVKDNIESYPFHPGVAIFDSSHATNNSPRPGYLRGKNHQYTLHPFSLIPVHQEQNKEVRNQAGGKGGHRR